MRRINRFIEAHGTGTGLVTGESYVYNDTFVHFFQDDSSDQQVFYDRRSFRLITKGPGPDAHLTWVFKTIQAANGNVIIDGQFESAECHGGSSRPELSRRPEHRRLQVAPISSGD